MAENNFERDENGVERDESGRLMLSFPSMDNLKSESSVARTSIPGGDANAEASRSDDFFYNPDDTQEDSNREYAMKTLQNLWGSRTTDNIETARWVLDSYADEDVIADLNRSGLGSHPDMIEAIYEAAQRLGKESAAQSGSPGITGRGMASIAFKKMGERSREVLNQAIYRARMDIIKKHGAISSS